MIKFNIQSKKTFILLTVIDLIKNSNQTTSQQIHEYQQKIKFMNFATVIIKSNVVFVVFKLSKFLTNSSFIHLNQADRILSYLRSTKHYFIHFNYFIIFASMMFLISSDVLFVDDKKTRFSSQEYAFKLFDDLID